ncbi:SDR family NAD(P)-dependent oxidoreductase [Microbulbifer pacificus]|uniref:SDR family NAD(P)-dependent oxidoreductase n=1 Tax=Microbulbifer pacificus TaxID=407164 RepID=UPI000CF42A05|nr:SDR family NAD(P)-dependent oxidoreductase [Microbulbifer pacificus]
MNIKDKVAIVTGGASGLGRATVERYLKDGAKVAIFDMNAEAGSRLAADLGANVAFFTVDVSDEDSVAAGIKQVLHTFGEIHILNNFAGIAPACKTLGKRGPHPLPDYMKVIMINQVGSFNMARLCAEQMAKNSPVNEDGERGVIINTASVAAYEGQIGQVAYSASKAAVVGMTLPMARELAPYGIRVVTIAPGLVHTPLFDAVDETYYKSLEASTVFPSRLGRVSEIADLSAHLIENSYINGECIRIDAGIRMQPK